MGKKIKGLIKLIKFIFFNIIDFSLLIFPVSKRGTNLLIFHFGAIGDYLLLRNFFYYIKRFEGFKNLKVTLFGNEIWRDLSETLDKEYIDEFYWVSKRDIHSNPIKRWLILKKIRSIGSKIVICPTQSRSYLTDVMVLMTGAPVRIGSETDLVNIDWWKKFFSDKFYTMLIKFEKSVHFEFEKNRYFFLKVWEKFSTKEYDLNVKRLLLMQGVSIFSEKFSPQDLPLKKNNFKRPYIVIFPGAGSPLRRWSIEHFSRLIILIIQKSPFSIVLAGSKEDQLIIQEIEFLVKGSVYYKTNLAVFDLKRIEKSCNTGSLLEIAGVIKFSSFVITNESMAAHMAVALDKKFICISNGNHLLRFHPYPPTISNNGLYVYPKEISELLDILSLPQGFDYYLYEKFLYGSSYCINSISVNMVWKKLEENFLESSLNLSKSEYVVSNFGKDNSLNREPLETKNIFD